MKKLKKIVVGIDIFSKSNNVLKRALIIARENKAELYIVYIVETPWLSLPDYFGGEEISIDTKTLKKKISKKVKLFNRDNEVHCTAFVKVGSVVDTLLYEANLLRSDMIIIGANTKKQNNYLGTSAEKLVNQSNLTVLVVKNNVKKVYKKIVAATDFQTQSIQSIEFTKNIFPKATISVVHSPEMIYYIEDTYMLSGYDLSQFNDNTKKNADRGMKKLLQDLFLEKGTVIDNDFNVKKALLDYIQSDSFDLTVVGSRNFEGLSSLLGSVSSTILRKAKTDVLIYVP